MIFKRDLQSRRSILKILIIFFVMRFLMFKESRTLATAFVQENLKHLETPDNPQLFLESHQILNKVLQAQEILEAVIFSALDVLENQIHLKQIETAMVGLLDIPSLTSSAKLEPE